MVSFVTDNFSDLMHRGGPVMWPLLLLSVAALALIFERCWFFAATNRAGRLSMVRRLSQLLREGQHDRARDLAASDRSIYGRVVERMLEERLSESAATEAIELERHHLERFMPTLSTIITAAPMLGILGTVLGIISSFELLSTQSAATDPRLVSQGIAEALITTAAGLVIAVVTLFPYNALRAQVDRTLSRIETLAAAALHRSNRSDDS